MASKAAKTGTKHGGKRAGCGRKKGSVPEAIKLVRLELKEMLQAHVEEAVAALAQCLHSDNDGHKIAAADLILSRVYGRPLQPVFIPPPDPMQTQFIRYLEVVRSLPEDDRPILEGVARRAVLSAPDAQGDHAGGVRGKSS